MKEGAMIRMLELTYGIIYHNFIWTYFGYSGGHKMPDNVTDFIPDKITHIHYLENN